MMSEVEKDFDIMIWLIKKELCNCDTALLKYEDFAKYSLTEKEREKCFYRERSNVMKDSRDSIISFCNKIISFVDNLHSIEHRDEGDRLVIELVKVDRGKCIGVGCGSCVDNFPFLFLFCADGEAVQCANNWIDDSLKSDIEDAVKGCAYGALSIIDKAVDDG
jgi:ferredoxin